MGEFADLSRKLGRAVDVLDGTAMRTVLTDVGVAAKKDLRVEAERTVGTDLKFSGWPRGGKLSSGFEVTSNTTLTLSPRPYGVWVVADRGRKATTAPRRGKKSSVVTMKTPWGPRSYTKASPLHIGRTRGHRTLTLARERIEQETPKRVFTGVQRELRKAWV